MELRKQGFLLRASVLALVACLSLTACSSSDDEDDPEKIAERTRDVPVHTEGDRTRDRESVRQHPQGP